jgi:hypothetical protein
MTPILLSSIITLHFLFDWILQPRSIAKAKGNSERGFDAVMAHMLINILPFSMVVGCLLVFSGYSGSSVLVYLLINGISHFLIDILLPKGKNERQMINLTAIDQILHISILINLLYML